MISEDRYVRLIADLLNKDSRPKSREQRVREANRQLFKEVVEPEATTAQADLALARAAELELAGRHP